MTATSITFSSSYSVSGGAALVTVHAYMNLSSGSSSAGTYPASWWGHWGNGSNNVYRSFSGSVVIVSWSGWVSLAYGSTTTIGFGASGTNYWGSASGEHYVTLPAQPYALPRAPLSPSAVRVSDTQATASWAANYDGGSGAQPWTGVYVDRWSKSSNTWTRVATVGWNTTSWTDQGIAANNQYKYRYASYNPTGQSSWVETALFATTPSAPQTVVAEKTGGNINVSWTNTAVQQDGAIIYDNGVEIATVGAGISSYTHVGPSTLVTHQYTIRATTTTPALQSSLSSASNIVQLLAAPNAPTNLSSSKSVYVQETDDDATLSWIHNPVDASSQTEAQIRVKGPGDAVWTDLSAFTQSAQTRTVGIWEFSDSEYPPGLYQWEVRTKGAYVDWSPWSATATFQVENMLQVTILSPDPSEIITTSRATLEWSYAQAQARPQQSYDIVVINNGQTVHTQSLASTSTSVPIGYTLADGQAYQFRLEVTASNGLKASLATVDITVDYLEPAHPALSCEFDPVNGANNLQIINDPSPIAAQMNRVYRNINQDSEWYGIPASTTPPAPITNVYTDPSFEVGTNTEVARNLFTNPNLVGDGTWAEVRRNLVANPSFEVNLVGWNTNATSITRVTAAKHSGSASLQVICASVSQIAQSVSATVTPSQTYIASAWVKGEAGKSLAIRLVERDNYDSLIEASQSLDIFCTGEWQRVSISRLFSVSGVRARVELMNRTAGAHTFYVDAVQLEVGSVATPYFDGSSPQGSIDPDMRQRWIGTPNASESVLEIERVAGLTATNCIAGVSTRDGKPAVRLIPTGTNASYAEFPIPVAARGGGVALGISHLDAPLTGSLFTERVGAILSYTPTSLTSAFNSTGSSVKRLVYGALTSGYGVRFNHGGSLGSGDVWWTDIGLFAGVYEGDWFSGDESPDPDLTASWAGTPDNSESILTAKTFPQITGGIQTDSWAASGTKSLRVDDIATLTVANPSTVVAVAKNAGQTLTGTTVATSTEAGETLRVEATGQAVLNAGYWDNLTVVEGSDYTGEAFHGSSGSGKTPETFLYDTIWDGAVNASTSTRTFLYPAFLQDDWEFVGEVPANTTLSDFEGLTYGRTMYLIEAVSDIPSSASAFISVDASSKYAWIGHGQAFASVVSIPFDLLIQESTELADESSYIFDGRDLPVSITGIARSHSLSVSGTLDPLAIEGSSWLEMNRMAGASGIKVYRDHDGRRLYAQISGMRIDRKARDLRRVIFSVKEVEQL